MRDSWCCGFAEFAALRVPLPLYLVSFYMRVEICLHDLAILKVRLYSCACSTLAFTRVSVRLYSRILVRSLTSTTDPTAVSSSVTKAIDSAGTSNGAAIAGTD